MIYCGYQGVGKSTYCRKNPTTTVDLDSSNFPKVENWFVGYVAKAKELSDSGLNVFISAHKIVIEYLLKSEIDFAVLIPILNKDAWKSRLEFRYFKNPTQCNFNAVKDFELNYDSDMKYYNSLKQKNVKVFEINARVETNLSDFI